jgi:signal peptidase II
LLPPDSAIRFLRPHLCLWVVAAACLALDLWSKAWAVSTLPVFDHEPTPHFFGRITFHRSFNAGALFGLGEGMSIVFILASILALLFVLYLFACSTRSQWAMHLALGLILAGALGNLYDRATCQAYLVTFVDDHGQPRGSTAAMDIVGDPEADPLLLRHYGTDDDPVPTPRKEIAAIRRKGVVRDFIKIEPVFGLDVWRWVFNVADVALTCGVAILLISFWIDRRRGKAVAAAAGRTEDATA